ncbi:hypothetical protein GJ744_000056 [Endocarpon pusillum]|uniref:Uncharacterized protein n=1 Tax=Endocarpon pusillum TaxID=364733 RepID=A0A8H7EC05_9EURO|nr:hypothetical protein GJ744_000056 [Endocarpon pusillum]
MKKQAPNTGCYMNEANRLDPEYQQDFKSMNPKGPLLSYLRWQRAVDRTAQRKIVFGR